MKRSRRRVRRLSIALSAAGVVALSLTGCTGGPEAPPLRNSTQTVTRAPEPTPASCLASEPEVRATGMGQVEVQVLGTGSKVVVISNQSGQDLCGWKAVAEALVSRGYEVALYDYVGAADENAVTIATLMRAQGATKLALLGASQGAKASIIAATRTSVPPDALVALSGEQYLEGQDVSKSAAKLRCPTLFVTADHDPFDATSANEEFQRVAPKGVSTLTVVPGTDHGIQLLGHPDVSAQVFAFLQAHLG
ncbi:hypothetical protein [Humibacter sp.]|uniref:alpha/beta hydrolase n=1 Tax=Humibacter sp. TaxID=1940291 RepID=UPI003F7F41C2